MRPVKFSLLLALALVAACAVSPPDNTFAYRPGFGVVTDVREARVAIPDGAISGSAAAGGRLTPLERAARPRWTQGHQLTLRMDDGTTQVITQDSEAFQAGERVQVTQEGRVLKAIGSPVSATVRPGLGTVQSASLASPSAAAGGSVSSVPMQQLDVRMDDGTVQVLTVQGAAFGAGERVRITPEGHVLRP